jgi:hypothetical protein
MTTIDNIMALVSDHERICCAFERGVSSLDSVIFHRKELRAAIEQLPAENEALRTALKAVMALPAMNNSGDGTMEFYHAVRGADAALARAGGKT